MASNQIKLDAIPLDEFKGNSREYLDYLKKFFIINDINVKEDIEYVKRFLRIQSNFITTLFFDIYKDIESWDRKAVEEFCSSLMSDFPNRSTNELTDLVTVDEYYAINDIEKLVVPSDSKNDKSLKNSTFPPEFREEDKPVSQTASSEKVKDKVKNPNISDLTVKIDNIKSLSETGTSKITWSNSNLQPSKTLLDKHFSYSLSIRENNLDELDGKFVESINPDTQLDKLNKKTDKIIYPTMYGGTIDSRRKTKSSDYCHNISSPVDRTVDSCHSCLTMRKFPYKLYASWVTATHPRRISSLYSCYVSNSTLIMLVDYLFNFMYGQVLPDQFSQAIIKFLSPTMDEYPLFILIYDAESALTSNTLSEFFSSYRIGFHSNLQPSNTQKITSIKYRLKSNGRNEGHINSLHKTFQKADLLNILPFQRLQWATIPLNTSLSRTKNSNGGNQFLLPAEKYYLDWSVILLKLPTFEECAPSSLHTSYTLSDSILLSNNKSTVKVPESSLTTPPFFPPECQHALDESLDKSHVEIYLNSLQPSINVQKVVINVDCDYASDTASYDWYEREFDKKGKYPHSNLWKQIADLMPSSYWAYHCIRDVFPLHMIIRKSF